MPLNGQASGGWTESSSQLRILHVGVRNSTGVLSDDSFTQTNPPAVTVTTPMTISTQVNQTVFGVIGGSVCFARPDGGSNVVGGPGLAATQVDIRDNHPEQVVGYRPLGIFVNTANGQAFENTPGPASGKNTYVSSQGTYSNGLYESFVLGTVGAVAQGDVVAYIPGMFLMASRNGYIMPTEQIGGGAIVDMDSNLLNGAESFVRAAANSATVLGVVKMTPDAEQNEVVYDQRI
jgi:hypothetical protein